MSVKKKVLEQLRRKIYFIQGLNEHLKEKLWSDLGNKSCIRMDIQRLGAYEIINRTYVKFISPFFITLYVQN